MKKHLILTLLLVLFSISRSNAQSETLDNLVVGKFDTWSIGLHISANNPNGDASDGKSQFSSMNPNVGYGLTVSKQLSHFLGFEFDYANLTLGKGGSSDRFVSEINQFTGRVRVNFTNGQILANYDKTQVYGFLGLGMVHYNTTIMKPYVNRSDWVNVMPFGFGFKKKLGGRASMNLELGYNRVNTDLLDGLKRSGSEKDGYTDVRIGVQYTLGKKKKPLEWDEALSYFKPSTEHSVDTLVIIKKEIVKSEPSKPELVRSLTIWYDTGDYLINGIYSQDMRAILKQLKDNPESWVEVLAYCDSTGSEKVNSKLVVKRSRLVNDYFVNEGVNQERIKVYNYGMEFARENVASKDRRVVIKYWKSEFDKSSE